MQNKEAELYDYFADELEKQAKNSNEESRAPEGTVGR